MVNLMRDLGIDESSPLVLAARQEAERQERRAQIEALVRDEPARRKRRRREAERMDPKKETHFVRVPRWIARLAVRCGAIIVVNRD